jgi:hypothetical protein
MVMLGLLRVIVGFNIRQRLDVIMTKSLIGHLSVFETYKRSDDQPNHHPNANNTIPNLHQHDDGDSVTTSTSHTPLHFHDEKFSYPIIQMDIRRDPVTRKMNEQYKDLRRLLQLHDRPLK